MKNLCENSNLISRRYQKIQNPDNQDNPSMIDMMGEDYNQMVKGLKKTFDSGKSKDLKFRLAQLKNLKRLYEENASDLIQALQKDLRKPELEGYMYEILLLLKDVNKSIKNLSTWTNPKKIPKNLACLSDDVSIDYQPHGVVLIIGPWNYPLHLTLMPLAGSITGGNCAVIKPSEVSSHCTAMMAALIPKYLDQDCFKIVQGDANETQKLLQEKFDFIFFTGSSQIGKLVYAQAALTLTPVCLELGGKSPVYIDSSADIRMAAQRILWAKCCCLGQTCVSPDFILCTKEVEQLFIQEAKTILKEFYGESIQESKDLSRVINQKHFSRLRRILNETRGTIAIGGTMDEYDLFIEPTILVDVDEDEPSMTEEIFGPILPIYPVKNPLDAIDFINNRSNPLALYVFSKKAKVVKLFMEKTNSGGICVNDALYHTAIADIPFGGVGESGLGQYHGKYSFKTFSRPRAIVHRGYSSLENRFNYSLRYPPYTPFKFKLLKFGMGNFEKFYLSMGFLPYLFCFLVGLLIMYVYFTFVHGKDIFTNTL